MSEPLAASTSIPVATPSFATAHFLPTPPHKAEVEQLGDAGPPVGPLPDRLADAGADVVQPDWAPVETVNDAFQVGAVHQVQPRGVDVQQRQQEANWDDLTPRQKLSDFVRRHEYGVIVGSWAVAITGALRYALKDP